MTLDYTTHILLTKLSTVNVTSFYKSTTMTATFLGSMWCEIELINVHKWWNPRIFHGSYVITTLKEKKCKGTFFELFEHWRRIWGTLGNIVNLGGTLWTRIFFYTYVISYLCTKRRTFYIEWGHFLWDLNNTSIIRRLRPKCHAIKNTTFG